jgi:hypothetical protein
MKEQQRFYQPVIHSMNRINQNITKMKEIRRNYSGMGDNNRLVQIYRRLNKFTALYLLIII